MTVTLHSATRRAVVIGVAAAFAAAAALPAFAAATGPSDTASASMTLQQKAAGDSQSLLVASEAESVDIERDAYVATTPAEIAEARAAEEARVEAARQAAEDKAAEQAAAEAAANGDASDSGTAPAAAPQSPSFAAGAGEVRYPLPLGSYYVSRTIGNGHEGADMMSDEGTPIYAAHAGVVTVSDESYYGFGNAVVIQGTVGGAAIETAYAHMYPGSRIVSQGQTVQAGQQIGSVGNTGNSWGNHLHIEVHINGSLIEPISWLDENAG